MVEELLDIGEVRARTGLPASTLHHYEHVGLIQSAGRAGLRRQYEAETVDRLAAVILCRRAGFRLDQIARLLAARDGQAWKALVQARLATVRGQIAQLQAVEEGLTRALSCPSADVLHCASFREEGRAALPLEEGGHRAQPGGRAGPPGA